jgi:hypothetical protein
VALSGEAQRLLLHRAVEATLADAARAGLGAIIVDDLHLGDDASIAVLQSLIQAETLAPLRWGFAQRLADAGPRRRRCARRSTKRSCSRSSRSRRSTWRR